MSGNGVNLADGGSDGQGAETQQAQNQDWQSQLKTAYEIFYPYAANNSGNFVDALFNQLVRGGVSIYTKEHVFYVIRQLSADFEVETKEAGRYVTFHLVKNDNEDVELEAKRQANKRKMIKTLAIVGAILLSLLAVALVIFLTKSSSVQASTSDYKEVVTPKVEQPEIRPVVAVSAKDSIGILIDSGFYSLALEKIRDSSDSWGDDFVTQAKKRINGLVISKADSLSRVIKSLSKQGNYYDAFELEQLNDKDIFQLAGNGISPKLRQRLITDWVLSYKNTLSKKEAMNVVGEKARTITKRKNHQVVEKGDQEFYLGYGSKKHNS